MNFFRILLLATLLLFTQLHLQAQDQDLYNYQNSLRFARHLFNSQQYKLALGEYERLIFLNPSNDTLKAFLLRCYRRDNNAGGGLQRSSRLYASPWQMPGMVATEHCKMLVIQKDYQQALRFADSLLTPADRQVIGFSVAILNRQWEQAQARLQDPSTPPSFQKSFAPLLNQYQKIPRKKPWLAACMSAVLPGSGRVYARQWPDGLMSVLIVGLSSWQAYRGFDKRGTRSLYGWTYAGLATGFYLGNIYGSYKAAIRFNHRYDHEIEENVYQVVFNHY